MQRVRGWLALLTLTFTSRPHKTAVSDIGSNGRVGALTVRADSRPLELAVSCRTGRSFVAFLWEPEKEACQSHPMEASR